MTETRDLKDDLDIIENRDWQERFWSFQRVAWLVMIAILIAAIFGATGSGGPLATAQVEIDGATVSYPRIARWQAAAEMTVELPPQAQGSVDIQVSSNFLDVFGVESISPTPSAAAATPTGHRYTFDVASGAKPKTLVLHLRAMRATLPRQGEVKIGNGSAARLNFVVLP